MTDAGLIVELLAKSSVIAGAGLVLAAALFARPAVERVDVLRAAVCILLGLPVIMALAPGLELALLPAEAAEVAPSTPLWQGAVGPVAGLSVSGTIRPLSLMDVVIALWVIGAVAVFGRFILGVLTLRRWTRSGRPVSGAPWTAPLEHLPDRRRPRVISSQAVESPLSWGLAPGVVLIGEACLARPQTAASVMAHELAHIRRGDWLFLALSRLALALFWFNPLVWLLHATLVSRTEDAADAAAIVAVDRRTYARALVGLAAGFRQPAAVGMAGDAQSLTRRIDRIMNARPATPRRPAIMALTIGALIVIATPIAAVEITQVPPPPPPSALARPAPPAPPAPPALMAMPAP
ncbi:MAG: M56 family metallopeptidase, partial [Alphaproteobacteria bacterium]|nr:M56 family metallopeptidase [Alphaproteobacteria bacterium]